MRFHADWERSSTIGLEIARQLAQAGIRVNMGARDRGRASKALAELSTSGLKAQSVLIDLDDLASIAADTIGAE